MAVSVPGIQGKVAIDGIEQAIRGLNQLAGAFDQVGSSAPKARKPVDDIVAALTKFSIIKEAASGLISLGQATIQSYSDNERLAQSLQALVAKEELASGAATNMTQALKNAKGQSQELLKWTQQLAIQSPFSQQGVAQAFKMAQAYGFVSETASKADVDAKRLTQAMIDFASGSGQSEETMSRIALALGQVQAKGKLAGGEMLQLTEAGLNVRQILADSFHKTTNEIVQMQEKGLIPANRAISAIVESLERDFGGAAKRQANMWAGLLNSISDIKEVGLREFFAGTFQAIQPLAQQFVDTLSDPSVQTNIRAWGESFGQVAAVGAGAIQAIIGNLQTLTPLIAGVTAAWVTYKIVQNAATIATGAQAVATLAANVAETASLIVLEAKTGGLIAAAVATRSYIMAQAGTAVALGAVALAVGAVVLAYQKYQQYQQQLQDGAQWILDQRQWWQDSTAALEAYNNASQATKNTTQGQADALTQLRDAQKQAIADYAAESNAAQAFGDTSEATAQRLESMRNAINARTQEIQNATSALETAITYEDLEANRLQMSAQMAQFAGDAYGLFNQQIQALIGVTQEAADKSLLDAQAKDAQKAKTLELQQETINAANAFMLLNPNIDGSGVASAQASGKISMAVAQYIAMTLATAEAKAKLAALQAQAGVPMAVATKGARQGGAARADALLNAGTKEDAEDIAAATAKLKAQAEAEKALADAKRNQILTTGTAAQKQALYNSEMEKAARIYGTNSAQYINAKTALDSFNASQAKASAGAGSRAAAAAAKETKAAEKLQNDLGKIEESGQKKLLDIDRKYAEQRAAAYRALAEDILTTSADMVAAQESNDLELAGMSADQLKAMVPREKAESDARKKAAEAAQEAQQTAATEGAEFAQKQYDQRMKQIEAQQRLDEEYYKRQQELAGNPEALAVLQQQYDEATAAIAQASQIRIDLAKQASDEAKAKADEEKQAVIASAQEQASKVKGASEEQKNAVISALQAQANQANVWAGAMSSAADRVISATQRAAGAIRDMPSAGAGGSGGGGSSGGPTHGGAQAAGGGNFIAYKPMTLTVGDAPDPELITVTPLGRKGQTRVGSGWVAMAGGGAILDPSDDTNPALNNQGGGSSGGGGGKKKKKKGKSPEEAAKERADLEQQYLDEALKKKLEWRKKAEDLDDEQYYAELALKRSHLPAERKIEEQRYYEDRNVKREQRDRMRKLEATWAKQDEAQKKKLDDQFAAQDNAARQRHYGNVRRNQQTYQMQLRDLQSKAQESESETTDFWYQAQASLYNDQMQAQNQVSQDALDQQLQHNQEAKDKENEQISQAEQDRRDELRENLQHQFDLEDRQRQDFWDITNEQRDDQYRKEKRAFDNYYNDRKDAQKAALDKEQETFDKFWESSFKKIAGGAAIYEELKGAKARIFAPEFLKLIGWAPRAEGGPVTKGQGYVVGERQAEFFVPKQDGYILPSVPKTIPSSGGSATTIIYEIHVDARGSMDARAVEEAGYRGAKKAIEEAGRRANTQINLRSITRK